MFPEALFEGVKRKKSNLNKKKENNLNIHQKGMIKLVILWKTTAIKKKYIK